MLNHFQIYLVGGAVRDKLLQYPVQERDWVVVGATAEEMRACGFKAVGKDFPVFLHPETKEEYALARTERKTAPGYKGFAFHAEPSVTLEQDLQRRDLTINAIAEDTNGRLIDPYGGQQDIQARILRHVSEAFVEDPVRILRVARFAARYAHLGFTIAEETQALMIEMTQQGEVDALVPERVWAELIKALSEQSPQQFFRVLKECQALQVLFPELDALFGVPQPAQHHPEIDTGIHTLMVLEQAARLSDNPLVRFAALMHDIGKGTTPQAILPSHHGHEQAGVNVFKSVCKRLPVPEQYKRLALQVMSYHTNCHRAFDLKPSTLVDTLHALDALRKDNTSLELFLLACEADARGRTGFEERDYPQRELFKTAQKAAMSVNVLPLIEKGLQGSEIGEALRIERIHAVKTAIKSFKDNRSQ
ncbi:MAG: multifunctional CCA addition/repair protein [Gammaproteobacteria bacterium]|nr:multifunctional CCA addition/repair protein [Gammaproteobacteria bacterium]